MEETQAGQSQSIEDQEVTSRDLPPEEHGTEDLKKRKKYELKLMRKFDKNKINVAKECWFLVDTMWLNAWSEFVNTEEGDPPGPISSKDLLNEEGNPIAGLIAKMDYRALPAISYFILKQLHGSDGSPDIPRYSVDIYKPAVPLHRLVSIQMTAVCEANIQVNRYRPKWVKWDLADEEEEEFKMFWCCGLTKEHLEAFIYWAVHCWRWSRKSSGRDNISYRQYRPLRGIPDDTVHGNSQHGVDGDPNRLSSSQHGGMFGSQHGNSNSIADDDGSTHNVLRELSSGASAKSDRRPSNASISRNGMKEEKKGAGEEESDVDCSSSSDEEEMDTAPADRGHEKGQWLRVMMN
eukprot:gene6480-7145_t